CFLDPEWWRDHPTPPDLLHIHFGFEFYDPRQLDELTSVLHARDVPLVFTVHDLRNPNHETRDLHDEGLDVLVSRADELVTLTATVAREIEQRWARQTNVLPHPHVADLERIASARERTRRRGPTAPFRLLIHFKSLRPNMVRAPLLRAAGVVARERDDLDLEVRLHCDVVSPFGDNHDPELVAMACDLADEGLVRLRVHPYLPHEELLDVIEGSDGFVLPYFFGTHSGLLELCRDLGTAVVAPSCGAYADQGAHHVFRSDESSGFDADSFRDALHAAVDAGAPEPLPPDQRDIERREVAEGHVRVYREVLPAHRSEAGVG
ncbi:MAG: hypothetical protein R3320_13705, partial [Nitriliruptorales bacterium]|nr:hypothetical protein [Nitriliruptorales bacterium]